MIYDEMREAMIPHQFIEGVPEGGLVTFERHK
jgi:hypothetical protein